MRMPRMVLVLATICALGAPGRLFAQPPPVFVSLDNVPRREFGFTGSLWGLAHGEEGMSAGGRYSRNLTDDLALEFGVDVGGVGGRAFALPLAQLRLKNLGALGYRPGFLTVGIARPFSGHDAPWASGDRLFVLGAGAQGAVTGDLALRFDAQAMIGDRNLGVRLMISIVGGRD